MPFKYESMQQRLIANSVHSTTSCYAGSWCWEWVGKRTANRAGTFYPRVSVREGGAVKSKFAHRVSVETFHGVKLSRAKVVKHLCNNALCVNPDHLEDGTQRENMRQMVDEGRDWYSKFVESSAVEVL